MMRAPILFACSLSAMAGDLTGIWTGQFMTGRNNDIVQDIAFKITQNGSSIGGKIYGEEKSFAITEGTLNGDQISFIVMTQEQAGNEINTTRMKYTGVVKDGEIELTREREGTTSVGNGGGYQFRKNTKLTFRLKKLL